MIPLPALLDRVALWCAAVPCALFCCNLFFFRNPPPAQPAPDPAAPSRNWPPKLSVLIPARNEERNISAAVLSVLASRAVDLELIVLDDASTDATAERVAAIAATDPRVRCVPAPALRPGWAGKAHAAHALAQLARHDVFCFLDADVRLGPDALARMHLFLQQTRSALVSGFPEELTVTPFEYMLLPLIQFLLLSYLPLAGLRLTNIPSFGAGCGQFLMMTRAGYARTGGYASVKTTMHDGIMLAKLFREHGLHSDVADLTGLAQCRMYESGPDVWQGLMKNATEGIAAPARIVPFTLLLLLGNVLPWACLLMGLAGYGTLQLAAAACALSLLPRLIGVVRFRQKLIGALLHPVGVTVFLLLQWSALLRKLRGTQAVWKGRAFNVG